MIYMLFTLHNISGTGQSPVAYSKTLAGWFDKDRGLALGIAIAGVGLGVIVMPQYAGYMIQHYGWRDGLCRAGHRHFCPRVHPGRDLHARSADERAAQRARGGAPGEALEGCDLVGGGLQIRGGSGR